MDQKENNRRNTISLCLLSLGIAAVAGVPGYAQDPDVGTVEDITGRPSLETGTGINKRSLKKDIGPTNAIIVTGKKTRFGLEVATAKEGNDEVLVIRYSDLGSPIGKPNSRIFGIKLPSWIRNPIKWFNNFVNKLIKSLVQKGLKFLADIAGKYMNAKPGKSNVASLIIDLIKAIVGGKSGSEAVEIISDLIKSLI